MPRMIFVLDVIHLRFQEFEEKIIPLTKDSCFFYIFHQWETISPGVFKIQLYKT